MLASSGTSASAKTLPVGQFYGRDAALRRPEANEVVVG
jgi:hypothetical protein